MSGKEDNTRRQSGHQHPPLPSEKQYCLIAPANKNASSSPLSDNRSHQQRHHQAASAATNSIDNSKSFIDGADITQDDVLCGSKYTHFHKGNERFREMMDRFREAMTESQYQRFCQYPMITRRAVAAEIAACIKGRFLKRPGQFYENFATYHGHWEELSQEEVFQKICEKFRSMNKPAGPPSASAAVTNHDLLMNASERFTTATAADAANADSTTTAAATPSTKNQDREDDDDRTPDAAVIGWTSNAITAAIPSTQQNGANEDKRKPAASHNNFPWLGRISNEASGTTSSAAAGHQVEASKCHSVHKSASSTRTGKTPPKTNAGQKRKVTPNDIASEGSLGKAPRRIEGTSCEPSSRQQRVQNQSGHNIQEATVQGGTHSLDSLSADAPPQESAGGSEEDIWDQAVFSQYQTWRQNNVGPNTVVRTKYNKLIHEVKELRNNTVQHMARLEQMVALVEDGQHQAVVVDSGTANNSILLEAETIRPTMDSDIPSIVTLSQSLEEQTKQLLAGIPQLEDMLQKEQAKNKKIHEGESGMQEWVAKTKDLIKEFKS